MRPVEILKRLKKEELEELCDWVHDSTDHDLSLSEGKNKMIVSLSGIPEDSLRDALGEILGIFLEDADDFSDEEE